MMGEGEKGGSWARGVEPRETRGRLGRWVVGIGVDRVRGR